MKKIEISASTMNEIKNYLNSFVDFDGEDKVELEEVEFQQGNDTIFVDAEVYGTTKQYTNDVYGGYADIDEEVENDGYCVNAVYAYDEDGDELDVVNADEI